MQTTHAPPQQAEYSIYWPWKDGKLSWPCAGYLSPSRLNSGHETWLQYCGLTTAPQGAYTKASTKYTYTLCLIKYKNVCLWFTLDLYSSYLGCNYAGRCSFIYSQFYTSVWSRWSHGDCELVRGQCPHWPIILMWFDTHHSAQPLFLYYFPLPIPGSPFKVYCKANGLFKVVLGCREKG